MASFVIYSVMLRVKTIGWISLSCLCLLTAYEELVEHFFPSSPTLWLYSLTFFSALQSIYNKNGEARILGRSWLSGHGQPYPTHMITVGHGLYVCCLLFRATGHFVHTLLRSHGSLCAQPASPPFHPYPDNQLCMRSTSHSPIYLSVLPGVYGV